MAQKHLLSVQHLRDIRLQATFFIFLPFVQASSRHLQISNLVDPPYPFLDFEKVLLSLLILLSLLGLFLGASLIKLLIDLNSTRGRLVTQRSAHPDTRTNHHKRTGNRPFAMSFAKMRLLDSPFEIAQRYEYRLMRNETFRVMQRELAGNPKNK